MIEAGRTSVEPSAWVGTGKVRAREEAGALVITIEGLTTQAKYYKPLIYEFFRKSWRGSRPAHGDFTVEILMEHIGDPPWMDLDNLAKAMLDGIKGYVFHDDAQVARLLVERRPGERERIVVTIRPRWKPAQPLRADVRAARSSAASDPATRMTARGSSVVILLARMKDLTLIPASGAWRTGTSPNRRGPPAVVTITAHSSPVRSVNSREEITTIGRRFSALRSTKGNGATSTSKGE